MSKTNTSCRTIKLPCNKVGYSHQSTFVPVLFGGKKFSADTAYIWTDGTNIYYSYEKEQYVLNKETYTWEEKTWSGLTSFEGNNVWTDGTSIYYTQSYDHYILNGDTWETFSFSASGTARMGCDIWTDGTNVYWSEFMAPPVHCVLNKETNAWDTKTFSGWGEDENFSASNIWTDGTDIYYSLGSIQRVLNKSTSTWTTKAWQGLSSFSGQHVWSDGVNIYCSLGGMHYILNDDTWEKISFNGVTSFYGYHVWSDGENIYASINGMHYILLPTTAKIYSRTSSGWTELGTSFNASSSIEIGTEVQMTALLETAEVGSIYKYTGTTGIYENGALYIVEAVS